MSALLYRALVGSHAYGTVIPTSDEDYVEVYIEDPEYITGLRRYETKFDSSEGRTRPGEQDTTRYGLQKWAHLVSQGNPNMIETLFIPNEAPIVLHGAYQRSMWGLIEGSRNAFLSKEAGRRFWGYAQSQQFAMTGARNKRTNRPELVHTHGYDTKFGGHLIRVLSEGIELMRTGGLTFPLMHADLIRQIRAGNVTKDECLDKANDLRELLELEIEASSLPEHADRDAINILLHTIYMEAWR